MGIRNTLLLDWRKYYGAPTDSCFKGIANVRNRDPLSKKEAGTALIRVLEKYQYSSCRSASGFSRPAGLGSTARSTAPARISSATAMASQQKLEQLQFRRAVVDELIRSIEAYVDASPTMTGKRAGPQANH